MSVWSIGVNETCDLRMFSICIYRKTQNWVRFLFSMFLSIKMKWINEQKWNQKATRILERIHRTYLLLKRLFFIQHLSQGLQDLNAQLLFFLHELLGVFDEPARHHISQLKTKIYKRRHFNGLCIKNNNMLSMNEMLKMIQRIDDYCDYKLTIGFYVPVT